jgi:hypothetical protein
VLLCLTFDKTPCGILCFAGCTAEFLDSEKAGILSSRLLDYLLHDGSNSGLTFPVAIITKLQRFPRRLWHLSRPSTTARRMAGPVIAVF